MEAADTLRTFTDTSGKAKLLAHFLISLIFFRIDLLTACGQRLQLILQLRYLELEFLDFISHSVQFNG